MIEISRTQDEEVGDGTTSVIILGENWTLELLVHWFEVFFFFLFSVSHRQFL